MRIRIKVVPDRLPDADGEWRVVNVPQEKVEMSYRTHSWLKAMALLSPYCPKDYHIVSYEKLVETL